VAGRYKKGFDPVAGRQNGTDALPVEAQRYLVATPDAGRRMAGRNADEPASRWIQFRIGINLGDVIFDDDDIFGDGVNVAARLQELAEPGGICVSRAVRDQVQVGDRFDLMFEDLGEQTVKNIVRRIATFRVQLDPEGTAAPKPADAPTKVQAPSARPSIAVLPFANMSGDSEQEFFADGLTEDIITALSRFRDLFVISRNSAFVYKGKAVRIQDVAAQFGVQYVVEGSVRKAGNRVRVTVQLIDASSDRHIWAERYDRELEDIFAIQDEVTSAIVATLPGRIEAATHDRAERKPTANMAAYEYVLTGKILHHRSTRDDNLEAQRMLDRAIALDPNTPMPMPGKAACSARDGCMAGARIARRRLPRWAGSWRRL
jgi:adenylate cyclase